MGDVDDVDYDEMPARGEGIHQLLRHGRPLDSWLTVDAKRCNEKKSNFLSTRIQDVHPSGSHEENWEIALKCCEVVDMHYGPRKHNIAPDRMIFRSWLQVHVKGHLPDDLVFDE